MRKFSKTSFFEGVRNWKAEGVALAVQERSDFISIRDNAERTALHICSRRKPTSAAEVAASLGTARTLINAGADINAIQPIYDDERSFQQLPYGALSDAVKIRSSRPISSS